jgi:hypothetical protein
MGRVKEGLPMRDLGPVAVVVVFFALALLFVRLCERLR